MFPNLFKKFDIKAFHDDICEFAKYKHVNFPFSNKRMVVPFALFHMDVWGPSSIPNLYGAYWFVMFINDYT